MVAKIDSSEAFAQMRVNTGLILGLIIICTLLAFLVGILMLQRRERSSMQAMLQANLEKEALSQHFEYLVKYANDMILLIDGGMRVAVANDRACEVYGYSAEEFSRLPATELVAPNWLVSHHERLKDLATRGFDMYESVHKTKAGVLFPVEISARSIDVEGTPFLQWIVRDITERKLVEDYLLAAKNELENKVNERTAELAQASDRLKHYATEVVRIQEREKGEMARELHDEIGQSLTGLKLMIGQLNRVPPEQAPAILDEARDLVGKLMGQVREMSLSLRPSMLDDLGLFPTLQWLRERYQNQAKIAIEFHTSGSEAGLSPDVKIAAYRVVQEALTNIVRYADVDQASVNVNIDAQEITLEIQDHGRGFDLVKLDPRLSFGITGMKERIRSLGGELTIQTRPGEGTLVKAEIPLSRSGAYGQVS